MMTDSQFASYMMDYIQRFINDLGDIDVRHTNHLGSYWELNMPKYYEVLSKWKKEKKRFEGVE